MEAKLHTSHASPERRPSTAAKPFRWFRQWVPQPVLPTGRKCLMLKWVREDRLKALKDKESKSGEPKPEATSERLFLCSYEGCGKTFLDGVAVKKHYKIHGERLHVCHYGGCGKKFFDSSKLKRHFLTHTGERSYICSHEGCGKAFSLVSNLKVHMRTHSSENYEICHYKDCGKRFTQSYKLQAHIEANHKKDTVMDRLRDTPAAVKKIHSKQKAHASVYGSDSADRPFACPYEGCEKSYIHQYKLNLHLRKEHPDHLLEENGKHAQTITCPPNENCDRDVYVGKGGVGKNPKRNKPKQRLPPAKRPHQEGSRSDNMDFSAIEKPRPSKTMYEDDSEETEDDYEDAEEGGWRYRETNVDDEETEGED